MVWFFNIEFQNGFGQNDASNGFRLTVPLRSKDIGFWR
jgi:hypothetical protein